MIALLSFQIDHNRQVHLAHIFFAPTKAAAEAELRQHAEACPKFGPAFRANETIEFAREIDSLPPADGDELEQWLDDELLLASEDAEDDVINI
jgi:hypothetical protein